MVLGSCRHRLVRVEGRRGGVLNELLPEPQIGLKDHKTVTLNTQRTFGVVSVTMLSEPKQTSLETSEPDRAERICRVEHNHLHKSRWAKLVSPAKGRL